MLFGSPAQSLLDFRMSVYARTIDVLFRGKRLLQFCRIAAFPNHNPPLVALLLPQLRRGDVQYAGLRTRRVDFDLEYDLMEPLLRRTGLNDVHCHSSNFETRPEHNISITSTASG